MKEEINKAVTQSIDLTALLPNFSLDNFTHFPQTAEQLSSVFVSILVAVFFFFISLSTWSYFKSRRQIKWVNTLLKEQEQRTIANNRLELLEISEAAREKGNHQASHQWMEFDETLIEVEVNGVPKLKNTIDSSHFFNPSTLAAGITESRMLAAVPGFLTALGVIGTFIGLQIGLAKLNIGADADIEQMKEGLAYVISGAKIAFMTSVWGVFLSVLFNFGEKLLENNVRKKISKLQVKIDNLFIRLSAEEMLQHIATDGEESRKSLQGLAEKIGEKMQESLMEVSANIQSGLEKSLEKIMAPAINKLVDETADGNQKALGTLVDSFLDSFGEQGVQQRVAMDSASKSMTQSLGSLDSSMNSFLEKLESSQQNSEDREKDLISNISMQVSKLVDQSNEQGKILSDFFGDKVSEMSNLLQQREKVAADRDDRRQKNFIAQTSVMRKASEDLLSKIEEDLGAQNKSTQKLLEQGEILQSGVRNSVDASLEASISLRESSKELNNASQEMKIFGSNIKDAGNSLAGAVTNAVESTADLATQNQLASESIEKNRLQLIDDQKKYSVAIDRLQHLLDSADSAFDKMRSHQDEFLKGLQQNVSDLSNDMTSMLSEYTEQVNQQTENTLSKWALHTTNYAEQMNRSVGTLSDIVDEIELKLGV